MNSVALTKELLQQQLSGCAVDGACKYLHIDKHLLSAPETNSAWLPLSWDCGHLLELAINDVKWQRKSAWINNFIQRCVVLMTKYSYGKQYEIVLETCAIAWWRYISFGAISHNRFCVSSERRVYETILRDWWSLHQLQEEDDQLNALSQGEVCTRTRRAQVVSHERAHNRIPKVTPKAKISIEYLWVFFWQLEGLSWIDFLGKLLELNDIYSLFVQSSMSIQTVNNCPWECTFTLERSWRSLYLHGQTEEKNDLRIWTIHKKFRVIYFRAYISPFNVVSTGPGWNSSYHTKGAFGQRSRRSRTDWTFFRENMNSSMKRHEHQHLYPQTRMMICFEENSKGDQSPAKLLNSIWIIRHSTWERS